MQCSRTQQVGIADGAGRGNRQCGVDDVDAAVRPLCMDGYAVVSLIPAPRPTGLRD